MILSRRDVQASLLSEAAHALWLLPTFPLTRVWSALRINDTMDRGKAAYGKVGACHSCAAMSVTSIYSTALFVSLRNFPSIVIL